MYKAISDYGIIGNNRFIALVSNEGSIDYCSMSRFDNPTVFAALLDDSIGGFFQVSPLAETIYHQEYVKNTNILELKMESSGAQSILSDFIPVDETEIHHKDSSTICRVLEQKTLSMNYELVCKPAPQYAQDKINIYREGNKFKFVATKESYYLSIVGLDDYKVSNLDEKLIINFTLNCSDKVYFLFTDMDSECNCDICELYAKTKEYWHVWISSCAAGSCPYLGEYDSLLKRSLLVLKLLTYDPSGAIVAAATTSLPEAIGASRNWDYRYTWIRDASFTLKALFDFGHIKEADGFIQWLSSLCTCHTGDDLKIMYSIEGRPVLTEIELDHLKGYMGSKPVRVGNEAWEQNQWDIYGEMLDTFLRISDFLGQIDETVWPFLVSVCEMAIKNWNKPDAGIWEHRNGPFHFTYSKVMCWVAIDRALKIAKRYGFEAPIDEWSKLAHTIKADVIDKAFNKKLNTFVQYYGSDQLDASLLLLPLVGFLEFDDPRVKSTIKACEDELMKNGFMLRYINEDGLDGEEGSFLLCNFWYVQCLAKLGEVDKAKKVLSTTLKAANRLGLLAEEFDSRTKTILGNFPQAFSHVGFLNSVKAIMEVENLSVDNDDYKNILTNLLKILPFKSVLNKRYETGFKTTTDIAKELRLSINLMHGTFFDSYESKVDYTKLRSSRAYKDYLQKVSLLDFFDLAQLKTDDEKKAFWINIYNVLIVHGVVELKIKKSVREVFDYFSRIAYQINGIRFSADEIEHGILRANRKHPGKGKAMFAARDKRKIYSLEDFDPRIHFALVCAASSCPPISFYSADKIDRQLDQAAKSFMNRGGIELDKKENILYLSQIFKWYKKDFAQTDANLIEFIVQYCDRGLASYLVGNKLSIKYMQYNWDLNSKL